MNTYKEYYQENVVPALMEKFSFKSNMQAPRLLKITLNMGLGSAISDKKILEKAQEELTQISDRKLY
jgi:large subunit ribosomal protein L5